MMNRKPIHVFAKLRVKDGHFDTVVSLLAQVANKSELENGNLFYRAHRCNTESNTIILFEGYWDEAAQQAHQRSEHYQRLVMGKIIPLLEHRELILTTPLLR